MKIIRVLLLPISILYGCITWLRNLLFDIGILNEKRFKIPVISIGNLKAGGTGKTPHIEYLVELLKNDYTIATLSRGYGRITSGYRLATLEASAKEIGDEPRQLIQKFKDKITVAVDENRVRGIKQLIKQKSDLQVVLLDDAFQHRQVKPGINILLTPYQKLYINDQMLPTGYLREWPSGSRRADVIIVTKTPPAFSALERRIITEDLNPKPYQKILFSYYEYGNLTSMRKMDSMVSSEYYYERKYSAVLLTGIANSSNLYYYLKNKLESVVPIEFADHHQYSVNDIKKVKEVFDTIASEKKIIITTEKDVMRLSHKELAESIKGLPIFYLPIQVKFHGEDGDIFNKQVLRHVRDYKIDS
ncbi:MAG: tetraacyldisaccharide 4'-kinase [Flavobacteriales bacterium]|nr:tetraacyldisaccharide 4'-kinase [Flavobacteriales bacterium]